jgi:hypothetical protein
VKSLLDNQVLTDYRFDQQAVPRTADQYRAYREHCLTFLQARNHSMQRAGRLSAAVACRVCGETEPSTQSMYSPDHLGGDIQHANAVSPDVTS